MAIWSSEIRELEKLYPSIRETHPKLGKELSRLIQTEDENMALVYARRCLETIVTDLCECELNRPRGSEPLKRIMDKLNRDEKVPPHIIAAMNNINSLSTFGAHPKEFDPQQVKPVLLDLHTTLGWYINHRETRKESATVSETRDDPATSVSVPQETTSRSRNRLFIIAAGSLALVFLVVLYFLKSGSGTENRSGVDKAIAVLPFKNDSPDEKKMYFINGTMEAILDNLCKIEDLRVVSRNSVEQYRDHPKTTPEIAKELNVSYLLEGSGHRDGESIRLFVQLLDGKNDRHIWSKSFVADISEIFAIQSEIAQSVASEIDAIITPEESRRIEKAPTQSQISYDLFQRASALFKTIRWNHGIDTELVEKTERLLKTALEYDSTFAICYTYLAALHTHKSQLIPPPVPLSYFDSSFRLIDLALKYDPELAEAYINRGIFYNNIGDPENGLAEFDKAILFDPNSAQAHHQKSVWNQNYRYDLVQSLESRSMAYQLEPVVGRSRDLFSMAAALIWAGFPAEARVVLDRWNETSDNQWGYFFQLGLNEHYQGNYAYARDYFLNAYREDSTQLRVVYRLGENCIFQGKNEEALRFFHQYLEEIDTGIREYHWPYIGYAFLQNDSVQKGERYLNQKIQILLQKNEIGLGSSHSCGWTYHWLALCYAALGKADLVVENLRVSTRMERLPLWMINELENSPIFDTVRGDPEFRQIVNEARAKYQAEHERVGRWLKEHDVLQMILT